MENNRNPRAQERIHAVVNRLFKTRARAEVVLRPYMKNEAQHVDRGFWCCPERVDLKKLHPQAAKGDACFVRFLVSSKTEDDGYLKITPNVDVYLDGVKVFGRGESTEEFVLLPLHFTQVKQEITIKSYCEEEQFGFSYIVSSKVYSFMWAMDYLLHIRRTLPMAAYAEEEGIAVSALYPADAELPQTLSYVFPKEPAQGLVKDFAAVYPEGKGYIGYAYSEVKADGCLEIQNASPIKVFVNGVCACEAAEAGTLPVEVKKGDRLLVRCCRADEAWSFSCEDALLENKLLCSDRGIGDSWMLIGSFGREPGMELAYGPEKLICEGAAALCGKEGIMPGFDMVYRNAAGKRVFWRLADGSYVRPYLDSFFFGQWYYALMLGHWGILKAAKALDQKEWQDYFVDSISILGKWFEYMKYDYEQLGVVTPFLQRSLVLDHLDPLGTMGMNLAELYLMTGEPAVKNTVYELRDALYRYVPRMENGIINRKETIWSDDLFMGVPFLVRLGRIFEEQSYYEDAFTQLKEYFAKMFIEEDKVFSHVFFVEDYVKSNVPWGRGNGWVIVAMCEYLDNTPADDVHRSEVELMYRAFAEGIIALQGENGLWHQVLNMPESYEETSCTAMFLYGLCRGVKTGLLTMEQAGETIHKAFEGLCRLAIDENGNTRGVCMGSGCGRTPEAYTGLRTVNNDDHATGIILAAFSEYMTLE